MTRRHLPPPLTLDPEVLARLSRAARGAETTPATTDLLETLSWYAAARRRAETEEGPPGEESAALLHLLTEVWVLLARGPETRASVEARLSVEADQLDKLSARVRTEKTARAREVLARWGAGAGRDERPSPARVQRLCGVSWAEWEEVHLFLERTGQGALVTPARTGADEVHVPRPYYPRWRCVKFLGGCGTTAENFRGVDTPPGVCPTCRSRSCWELVTVELPADPSPGRVLRCPDCTSWAALVENAHAHRLSSGHGPPVEVPFPLPESRS